MTNCPGKDILSCSVDVLTASPEARDALAVPVAASSGSRAMLSRVRAAGENPG